jgi:hypothetical protein
MLYQLSHVRVPRRGEAAQADRGRHAFRTVADPGRQANSPWRDQAISYRELAPAGDRIPASGEQSKRLSVVDPSATCSAIARNVQANPPAGPFISVNGWLRKVILLRR